MADRVKTAPYRFRLSRTDTLALDSVLPVALRSSEVPGIVYIVPLTAIAVSSAHSQDKLGEVRYFCEVLVGILATILLLNFTARWLYSAFGRVRRFYWRDCSLDMTDRELTLQSGEYRTAVDTFSWADLRSVFARAGGKQLELRFDGGSNSATWLVAPSSFKNNQDWLWFITQLRKRRVKGYEGLPHFKIQRGEGISECMGIEEDRRMYPLRRGREQVTACLEKILNGGQSSPLPKSVSFFSFWVPEAREGTVRKAVAAAAGWCGAFSFLMLMLGWNHQFSVASIYVTITILVWSKMVFREGDDVCNPSRRHGIELDRVGIKIVIPDECAVTTYPWASVTHVKLSQGRLEFYLANGRRILTPLAVAVPAKRTQILRLLQFEDIWGWEFIEWELKAYDANLQRLRRENTARKAVPTA